MTVSNEQPTKHKNVLPFPFTISCTLIMACWLRICCLSQLVLWRPGLLFNTCNRTKLSDAFFPLYAMFQSAPVCLRGELGRGLSFLTAHSSCGKALVGLSFCFIEALWQPIWHSLRVRGVSLRWLTERWAHYDSHQLACSMSQSPEAPSGDLDMLSVQIDIVGFDV